jgi:hypothetical protein
MMAKFSLVMIVAGVQVIEDHLLYTLSTANC